jgi:hypothetical protein
MTASGCGVESLAAEGEVHPGARDATATPALKFKYRDKWHYRLSFFSAFQPITMLICTFKMTCFEPIKMSF